MPAFILNEFHDSNQENRVQDRTALSLSSSKDNATKMLDSSTSTSESWAAPLVERNDNHLSPCPSSASVSAKSISDTFFSPPATSSSGKSALTDYSYPASAGIQSATSDEAKILTHNDKATQASSLADGQLRLPSNLPSRPSSTSSSPRKNTRLPSLDIIAARLKHIVLEDGSQIAAEPHAGITRFDGSSLQPKRGRSEALATLRDRTMNRSRSTSPVKKNYIQPEAGKERTDSANVNIPSLEDIAMRLGKREQFPCKQQASISGTTTPLPRSPIDPVPASPIHNLAHGLPPGFSNEFLTPSKTRSKAEAYAEWRKSELARQPNDHPLEHTWGMYFDCKTWAPSGSPIKGTNTDNQMQSWENVLRLLGHFVTVESFMAVFRTLRRPSQLERNSSYHLFKNGIKPMWEDPANAKGGKWILTLRGGNSALLDRSWMWLVLALIGEDLDERDDITGAVVSTRPKGDRIALWIREKTPANKVNAIGRRFVKLLEVENEKGVSLDFSANSRDDVSDASREQDEELWHFDNPLPASTDGTHSLSMSGGLPFTSVAKQNSLCVPVHSQTGHSPRSPTIPLACLANSPSKGFVDSLRANNAMQAARSYQRGSPIKAGRTAAMSVFGNGVKT